MLDADLATLYGVETKVLNLAVRRNRRRFPADFMFQLTREEVLRLRFQIETSKIGRGGRRYLPYVFTEQGVAMLSSTLKSDRAVAVNILIGDRLPLEGLRSRTAGPHGRRRSWPNAGRVRLVEVAGVKSLAILRFVKEHEERDRGARVRDVVQVPDEIRQQTTDREYPIGVVAAPVDLGADPGMRRDATNEHVEGDPQRLPLFG